eukprot:SAG31_NODE_4612_length_3097_cov_2.555704_2_plen_40_part_00
MKETELVGTKRLNPLLSSYAIVVLFVQRDTTSGSLVRLS